MVKPRAARKKAKERAKPTTQLTQTTPLSRLEETLSGCSNVLILCGAGISVSSGIPGESKGSREEDSHSRLLFLTFFCSSQTSDPRTASTTRWIVKSWGCHAQSSSSIRSTSWTTPCPFTGSPAESSSTTRSSPRPLTGSSGSWKRPASWSACTHRTWMDWK